LGGGGGGANVYTLTPLTTASLPRWIVLSEYSAQDPEE
jgi:hypothetical protein